MKYPREWIDSVRERSDIVELIGSYVTLRRAGSNYTGLCPFHSERTPSFTVFPDTQSFFCFGCEAGGDAFTFVMRSENLEYPEAVEFLAKRAGIQIPETHEDSDQPRGISRARAYELNRAAARFYRDCLFDPAIGEAGMNYLRDTRGLDTAVIRHFGLGYAPNEFGVLLPHLKSLGFTEEEMRQCFLCGRSQSGRYYDYFRGRVMFPVINTAGEVVAFSGRDVTGTSKAKYLNSSDTPVFQKRKNLFALNFAKAHCAEQMILCEGNMDVVSMHAAGFENAVASLGTALTDEQARIMARYTKQVIIAYDGDSAGQRAAGRAMDIFARVGLDVRVLRITDAKDPDEYIRKFGTDAFARLLKGSSTGFSYRLDGVLNRYNIKEPEDRIKAAAELCGMVARVWSSAEREVYLQAVSERLGLPIDSLRRDVERAQARIQRDRHQSEARAARMSALALDDRVNPEAAGNIRAAAAEDTVLGLMLLYEEHRRAVREGAVSLTADDFVTAFNRRVFEAIMELENSDGGFSTAVLGEQFDPDEMGRLAKLAQARRNLSENGQSVLKAAVRTLQDEKNAVTKDDAPPEDSLERLLEKKRQKMHKSNG
ncbi:MAG: DNA primase [Eubacteriales bacterium]|nr:DNA primase [Oscillospiraceae bacterium]MDY3924597.1 DNA primase [Eubacteriales bacterium]PWM36695.1 MAG: DNA primase [Oscillospiraceae bacterium]